LLMAGLLFILGAAASAEAMGPALAGSGTATIDGLMTPGEWDDADSFDFYINDFHPGPGRLVTLFVMNDKDNLYFALRMTGDVYYGEESMIDLDRNRTKTVPDVGDDRWFVNTEIFPPTGMHVTTVDDQYITSCGAVYCTGSSDTSNGGTMDTMAVIASDGTYTYHEYSHPLKSGDNPHDIRLRPRRRVWVSGRVTIYDPIAVRADGLIPPMKVRITKP
ncbi:MAG: hypothetical protein AAF614_40235, partial [Chloroflexota bacterium]